MVKRGESKLKAKQLMHESFGTATGAYMLSAMLSVGLLTAPAASLGIDKFSLSAVRGKKPHAGDVLSGFDSSLRALFVTLVSGLFISLWSLLGIALILIGFTIAAYAKSLPMAIIFYILGVAITLVLSIWKTCSYSMSSYILADNPNMLTQECIERSKEITEDHIMDLFVVKLTFIGWRILQVLFIPATLYVAPYYSLTMAGIYRELAGDEGKPAPAPEQPKPPVQPRDGDIEMVAGCYRGTHFPLHGGEEIAIGRDPAQTDIVLEDGSDKISRKHCTVRFDAAQDCYFVRDFSKNGTRLADGTLIKDFMKLRHGTRIFLGDKSTVFILN